MEPAILYERAQKAVSVATGVLAAVRCGLHRKLPPVYLDVGSRGGLPARWRPVLSAGLICPVYVEPDRVEAARLLARHPGVRVITDALGASDGEVATLYVTREPGRSSLLLPDFQEISVFADSSPWEVVRREAITIRRLDRIWGDCAPPELVKVDVQGYEVEVLKGMGTLLDSVVGLEVESSITPLYHQQATFEDIRQFLFEQGFDLVRMAALGLYRGETMIEFNTFWVRREFHLDPRVRLWKRVNGVGNARRVNVWGY